MGLLETRNLDFKTVHILSVNEGILPQSKGANSLIPYDIRKYYELPVYSNKQAVYAYPGKGKGRSKGGGAAEPRRTAGAFPG